MTPDLDIGAPDDEFSLFEMAGWSAAGLDALLVQNGLPAAAVGGAATADNGDRVLRLSPVVAWAIRAEAAATAPLPTADGVVVDLASSRVRFRLRGALAAALPRIIPVDCSRLDPGRFVATLIHGIPVTILKTAGGFELIVVRSFALSLAEWMVEAAKP